MQEGPDVPPCSAALVRNQAMARAVPAAAARAVPRTVGSQSLPPPFPPLLPMPPPPRPPRLLSVPIAGLFACMGDFAEVRAARPARLPRPLECRLSAAAGDVNLGEMWVYLEVTLHPATDVQCRRSCMSVCAFRVRRPVVQCQRQREGIASSAGTLCMSCNPHRRQQK